MIAGAAALVGIKPAEAAEWPVPSDEPHPPIWGKQGEWVMYKQGDYLSMEVRPTCKDLVEVFRGEVPTRFYRDVVRIGFHGQLGVRKLFVDFSPKPDENFGPGALDGIMEEIGHDPVSVSFYRRRNSDSFNEW
jgi:hypothetical protein